MNFSELERLLFAVGLVWALLALLVTCVAIVIAKRQVGRSIHIARGGRRMRAAVIALCALLGGLLFVADSAEVAFGVSALVASILVALLAPGVEDMALGENGARHGWQARNWRQLEGWRLTGSHLRFLVHGELVAVEVPLAEMDALQARLDESCADTRNDLGLAQSTNEPG